MQWKQFEVKKGTY